MCTLKRLGYVFATALLSGGSAMAQDTTPSFDVSAVDGAVDAMGDAISGVLSGSVQTNVIKVLSATAILMLLFIGFRWMFRRR